MPENILISKIRKAIASHKMFEAGDTVACAVSGGPDSVAMLHGLLELKEAPHHPACRRPSGPRLQG